MIDMNINESYRLLIAELLEAKSKAPARENMPPTTSLFGKSITCDLSEGFPLLTIKETKFSNVVTEFLWMMSGNTNVQYLIENGCNFWNEDAYNYYQKYIDGCSNEEGVAPYNLLVEEYGNLRELTFKEFVQTLKTVPYENLPTEGNYRLGDCGEQYGKLWREWRGGLDQIASAAELLVENPYSRRNIVTAWNPSTLNLMALPACHTMFQLVVTPDEKVNLRLYMRSCDSVLGLPYNIAFYALLLTFYAACSGREAGQLHIDFGDLHLYSNHIEAAQEIVSRTEYPALPTLSIATEFPFDFLSDIFPVAINDKNRKADLNAFKKDIESCLFNYTSNERIYAKLSTGLNDGTDIN